MTDTTIAAFDDTIAGGVRQDGQCQLEERLVPGRSRWPRRQGVQKLHKEPAEI